MNKFKNLIFLPFCMLYACSHTHHHSHSSRDLAENTHHHSHDTPHANYAIELPDDPVFSFHDKNNDGFIQENEIDFDKGPRPSIANFDNSKFSNKGISSLGLKKGQLLLTIDDGPTPGVTDHILDTLKDYNIKATFFVVGSRVKISERYKDLARRIVAEGHTIANHTMNHKVPANSSVVSEVKKAHQTLKNVIPGWPDKGRLYFRAPGIPYRFETQAYYLNRNDTTKYYIGPIHANIGTNAPRADWACWTKKWKISVNQCAQYYFEEINRKGKGIVLLHDLKINSAHLLRKILRILSERGGIETSSTSGYWSFVNMDDLSHLDQFELGEDRDKSPSSTCRMGASCKIISDYVNIRTMGLPEMTVFNWKEDSQLYIGDMQAKTSIIQQVRVLSSVEVFGNVFYRVVIEEAEGFGGLVGKQFFIYESALAPINI